MVKLHDGQMRIDSQGGKGTLVTIDLPASRVVAADPPKRAVAGMRTAV